MARRSSGIEVWTIMVMALLFFATIYTSLGWYGMDEIVVAAQAERDAAKAEYDSQIEAQILLTIEKDRNGVFLYGTHDPGCIDASAGFEDVIRLVMPWALEDKNIDQEAQDKILQFIDQEKIDEAAELLANSGWTLDKTVLRLTNALVAAEGHSDRLNNDVQTLKDTHTEEIARFEKNLTNSDGTISTLQSERDAKIEEVEVLNDKIMTIQSESTEEIERLRIDLKRMDLIQKEDIRTLESEIEKLQNRIKVLQERDTGAEGIQYADPDGQIINVDSVLELGTAYINIGSKHRLTNGMRFDVFQYTHSGSKKVKGKIEVREVYGDLAKVGVIELVDKFDPIVKGDYIHNAIYNPNMVPTYFIIGALQNHTKSELQRLIVQAGGKVALVLNTSVDYVVVGITENDDSEQDKLKEAKYLRIPAIQEEQLMEFLVDYRE